MFLGIVLGAIIGMMLAAMLIIVIDFLFAHETLLIAVLICIAIVAFGLAIKILSDKNY